LEGFRILLDVAALLGAAIAMGLVFHRLRQPTVIGYLVGGLIVGPHGLALVTDLASVDMFAQIGVVLLLFSLGVEFSLSEIKPVWRVAIFGTIAQIVLTVIVCVGAGPLLGLTTGTAVLLGFVIALSSTMIVLKVLMERGELDSMHGRVSLGILIVQDLSTVPMLLLIPNLADPVAGYGWPMVANLVKAAALLFVMWYLGTKLVPVITRRIAATGSRELFLLTAIALAFGTAASAYLIGLSVAVGAFLAGIVASESDESHHILVELRPLRDLFSTVFFTSLGGLLDLKFVLAQFPLVLGSVAALAVGKAALIGFLTRSCGYAGRTSLAVGLGLAQTGEFSFVLARMGAEASLLSSDQFSVVLAVALLSIILTPAMMAAYFPLYAAFKRRFPDKPGLAMVRKPSSTAPLTGLVDHVVVCGFGRVGRNVGEVLFRHQIPMLVIDIDQVVTEDLREKGIPCLYGDAANIEVLRKASLPLAKLLVVALPDPVGTRLAVRHAKQLNDRLQMLCRAHRTADIEELYALGADQVIQPEFEASVEAIRYTLTVLGYSQQQIDMYTSEIRHQHYRQFLDDFKPQDAATIWEALGKQDLQWLVINARSDLVGQSLVDSAIRSRTGVAILAIRRNGTTLTNPESDTELGAGDALLVLGLHDQIEMLEALANPPLRQ
jgi:CPA2 family monovalent cation:H+ antiporter-2